MGICFGSCVSRDYKIKEQEVPDEARECMLKNQKVFQWKSKVYNEIDKKHPIAKFWQAQQIAKHKHLVTLVVEQALQQIKLAGKDWTESELNQLLLIKENAIQTKIYRNEMVNQNGSHLPVSRLDRFQEEAKITGNQKNNNQKVMHGALEVGKVGVDKVFN